VLNKYKVVPGVAANILLQGSSIRSKSIGVRLPEIEKKQTQEDATGRRSS